MAPLKAQINQSVTSAARPAAGLLGQADALLEKHLIEDLTR
ncbi:hypothetical protein PMN64_04805 [Bradyrhizobium sp. UFLA01-814]